MTNLWCHPGLLSSSRRRGSMHLVLALFLAFFFVACSDDGSDFAVRPSDGSSSSVCGNCDDGSSSSVKSSNSSVKSSSSVAGCKTETEDNCEYGELVDVRDGQTYKTVKIGKQWWMAENLNYEVDSSFCYEDSAEYCEKYGRLYMWAAALGKSESECGYMTDCSLPSGNIQGVCPNGWHLPSKDEFETLTSVGVRLVVGDLPIGGQLTAGWTLKSMFGWKEDGGESGNGMDYFGFSAFPAGGRFNNGYYSRESEHALFWSSTEEDIYGAYYLGLFFDSYSVSSIWKEKKYAFSVRCVED